ncbi:MAG: hypothetical protein HY926_11595 [Elusimicrobia bacterium]|nr:hypothetical protein [Elusimicrobiota bacterium]
MVEEREGVPLHEALERLEELCRRLWDADAPEAIHLQAVIDEFSGSVRRAEQAIALLRQRHDELQKASAKEVESAVRSAIGEPQRRLAGVEARLAAAEASLAAKEARIQALMGELAAKEAQNLAFHEKYLKTAAEQDESRAQKMEAFYKQLSEKEAELESLWEKRHAALESEHKQRVEAFKKRQEELLHEIGTRAAAMEEHYLGLDQELEGKREQLRQDAEAWDARHSAESRALSQRQQEVAAQAESLAAEYQRKRSELQRIKESMQTELTRVVQEYQARKAPRGGRP